MVFNSASFLVLFAVSLILLRICAPKWHWPILLVISWYFYSWNSALHLFLILAVTFNTYAFGIWIDRFTKGRGAVFFLGLFLNLSPLIYYKYAGFIFRQITHFDIFQSVADDVSFLPVGLSFYTLQAVSYLVDVYRKSFTAERHFVRFALYIAYFGQLVAGPIDRASDILPQFTRDGAVLTKSNFIVGSKIFLRGLIKKMVIADGLVSLIAPTFANPSAVSWSQALLVAVSLPVFLYCDFSGYSTMAVGISRIMGISIIDNFQRPFFAANFADFWRRWHVSFYTFMRDYVAQPLYSLRLNRWAVLAIMWLVSSAWHGANWTFFIWGASQLFFIIIDIRRPYCEGRPGRLTLTRNVFFNFIFFMLGMFAFFSPSIHTLTLFVTKLLAIPSFQLMQWPPGIAAAVIPFSLFFVGLIFAAAQERGKNCYETDSFEFFDVAKLAAQLNLLLFFGNFGGHAFVYFHF